MKETYEITYPDIELINPPGLATVEMTSEIVNRILALREAVISYHAHKIVELNPAIEWTEWAEDDEGNTVVGDARLHTECDQLVVTKD